MLVAISGSQGCGKSTILKRFEDAGLNVVGRKTSRSILQDWNVTLQEVNANPELTMKFQDEISNRKLLDEQRFIDSKEVYFTERTHADLFTYALVSLGKDNQYSEWLQRYYENCMRLNQMYKHVYYLRAGHFNIEADGVRGANHHYGRMVDLTMLDMTQQMILPGKLTVVETPDLTQRVNMILTQTEFL